MDIETSGAYSPDKIYGQLSSPFLQIGVKINAHTPFDKEKEDDEATAVSFKDFHAKQPTFKYERQVGETNTVGLESNYKPSTVSVGTEPPEFPPKNVRAFSVSTSSKDIVQTGLSNGLTYDQAYVRVKAQKAYETSVGLTKNPVGALNERVYRTINTMNS